MVRITGIRIIGSQGNHEESDEDAIVTCSEEEERQDASSYEARFNGHHGQLRVPIHGSSGHDSPSNSASSSQNEAFYTPQDDSNHPKPNINRKNRILGHSKSVLFNHTVSQEYDHRYSERRESGHSSHLPIVGSDGHHHLSQLYESLDYDVCENQLYLEELKENGQKIFFRKNVLRWLIILMIAVITALTACFVVFCVDKLTEIKYRILKEWMDNCYMNQCLWFPFTIWLATNGIPIVIGSILVTYLAPVAAGSGIPLIKCYLNGVKVPEVVRIKTFLVKITGVITSIAGGLAVGKEGPMIHCGSVIAAGVSQEKSSTFRTDLKIFQSFRDDKEKRDFVSAGMSYCFNCNN